MAKQEGKPFAGNEFMIGLQKHLPEEKHPLLPKLGMSIKMAVEVDEMKSMKSKPDYQFMPPFSPEVVEWAHDNWTPRGGDVLVASYPKTGTTWLREVMRQLLFRGDENLMDASKLVENPFIGYLEAGGPEKYEVLDALPMKRRVVGTHLESELVNVDKYMKNGMKMVYIMRNPKDMIVSMKKFFESIPFMQTPGIKKYFPDDHGEFVKKMVEGKMPMQMKIGGWYPHHIRSWMKYKGNEKFHFVFYEDMKKDPKGEITKLAKFIDVQRSDADLDEIVKATSFDAMKKNSNPSSNVKMYRKGGVGNWKEHFTDDQSALVDQKLKEDLGDCDVNFIYTL